MTDTDWAPWAEILQRHRDARPSYDALTAAAFSPFPGGGANRLFRCSIGAASYLLKVSLNPHNQTADAGQREELVSILGRLLGVPTSTAWAFNLETFPADWFEAIAAHVKPDHRPHLVKRSGAVVRFIHGTTVGQDPSAAKRIVGEDPGKVADLFAFMLWIGDEDRGLADVMMVDGRLVLLDNGLCGPGPSSVIRGAHPFPGEFRTKPDTATVMCWYRKRSLVRFVLHTAGISPLAIRGPAVLSRIEGLPDEAVFGTVAASGLPAWVAEVLVMRRETIAEDYARWLPRAAQASRNPELK